MARVQELLSRAIELGASDLHLTVGRPPIYRIYGSLSQGDEGVLEAAAIKEMVYGLLTEGQIASFERNLELDASAFLPGVSRFRLNVHLQRGNVEAAFRVIPLAARSLDELGSPPVVQALCDKVSGLILVTGPAGVGKSTTLAAIIERINEKRKEMILTIEDPIEFVHSQRGCVVKQREVGIDTHSFGDALKHALRQDPDVIMIGEMRDLETVATCLTAAETGHLVLSTLHTPNAPQSIDRLIDVFPPHQQAQVRAQLASVLQGIVSQQLIPRWDGRGMALATEVIVPNAAARSLIREGKTAQLESVMQTGAAHGMHTMDQDLERLYREGQITYDAALNLARAPERMEREPEIDRMHSRGRSRSAASRPGRVPVTAGGRD